MRVGLNGRELNDPPSFCRQKVLRFVSHVHDRFANSVLRFSTLWFLFDVWFFSITHFSKRFRFGTSWRHLFLSVDYTPATVVTLTFAFDFTTTPQVLLCLGRGVFSFAFVAWCICGWALVVFPPTWQLVQYLFQYMINILLRSIYNFILRGTKSFFYLWLCATLLHATRTVGSFNVVGRWSLACALCCSCTPRLNVKHQFLFPNWNFSTAASCCGICFRFVLHFHCHVWFHLFRVSTCFEYSCSETKLHICHWLQWLYDVHWISATVVGGWVFTHHWVACCPILDLWWCPSEG